MNRKILFTTVIAILVLVLSACTTAAPAATTNNSDPVVEFTGTKLNLNTVTGNELLAAIPSFPSRMVREFQEYRPYVSIQQFRQEIGRYVDDAQIAEYEKYVYVPIAVNDSDSETLQQIPGLDSTEADSLISGRPYASAETFLAQLSGFVSADELEIAKSYLGDN